MKAEVKNGLVLFGIVGVVSCLASMGYSHCQIPCGIYNDPMRFDMVAEHITTIEKSMKEIEAIAGGASRDINQAVRWVVNKEEHADQVAHIITWYFMAQRVTPTAKSEGEAYEKYVRKITLLHEMLVTTMKCKQTTDPANVEKLKSLLEDFRGE